MPFSYDLRVEVGYTTDYHVPGRDKLETYFARTTDRRLLWNLTVGKRVIDRALGVGTTKVPLDARALDRLCHRFVLDEEQISHLLAYERRVTVWMAVLAGQPVHEGLIAQLSGMGFSSKLTPYLRDPEMYRARRNAAVIQSESRRYCDGYNHVGELESVGCERCCAYDPNVLLQGFKWSLGQDPGMDAAFAVQGYPANEWLVGQLRQDLAAWDLSLR
jgi:hypothetical protein